jgi:hypothetical protein
MTHGGLAVHRLAFGNLAVDAMSVIVRVGKKGWRAG